jgi:hypothetical protein
MSMEPSADESSAGGAKAGGTAFEPAPAPPLLAPGSAAPVAPPLLPPRQDGAVSKSGSGRHVLAILLSVCLALFLAEALLSFADSLLAILFDRHGLGGIRGLVFFVSMLVSLLVYVLMGITPLIPKRVFVPVTLFNPIVLLLTIPVYIYLPRGISMVDVFASFIQLILGFIAVAWLLGGFELAWPLVPERRLRGRAFSWANLSVFLAANIIALPAVTLVYLFACASIAIGRYSDGFLALHPSGLTVQAREYVRGDGKKILLVPMVHIGDADFYQKISQSFPTNSVILMEGVTDDNNLLTNRISYHRVASSLGLAEQQKVFRPTRGKKEREDVDLSEFTPGTIGALNVAMLLYTKGVNPQTVATLLEFSPPPHYEDQLIEDLLKKRNQHLLHGIHDHLTDWDYIVVPWGAAHLPGISKGVLSEGFRLNNSHEYQVIRFGRHSRPSGVDEAVKDTSD